MQIILTLLTESKGNFNCYRSSFVVEVFRSEQKKNTTSFCNYNFFSSFFEFVLVQCLSVALFISHTHTHTHNTYQQIVLPTQQLFIILFYFDFPREYSDIRWVFVIPFLKILQ